MIVSRLISGDANLDTLPDVVSIDEAAQALGIEPKRLRGFIARNGINDPIGNMEWVYQWSLGGLRKRLADQPAVVLP